MKRMRARIELAKLALKSVPIFRGLLREGEIGLEEAWMVLHGGGDYARAIATGDVADDEIVESRRAICAECGLYTTEYHGGDVVSHWCGVRLHDDVDDGGGCGCLIEGKTMVASQVCPHGRWAAVTVGVT